MILFTLLYLSLVHVVHLTCFIVNTCELFLCRFLDEAAGKANYSFTPYGSGRHRCLAETFADIMMRVTFATLIRMFEFDLLDGKFPEVNYQTLGATPLNPYIVYKKRVPNNTN